MGLLECSDVYWKFAGQCTQCGHCKHACTSLTAADMTLGDIAHTMLEVERGATEPPDVLMNIAMNPNLVQAVRGCFFCTSCKNTCFAHNDVCDLIYHCRIDFQNLGVIPRYAWTSVQVDQEWDIFKAYRAIYGIGLSDMTRHVATAEHEAATDCDVAFFPGCALAAYAPDLTREIFATIEELSGGKGTMIDHCCGSPLKSAGFFDRAEALCDRIADELAASGAREVVCVCPGCANAMRSTLGGRDMLCVGGEAGEGQLKVTSLSEFLFRHGFQPKHDVPAEALFISKSCQDRTGEYLEQTCQCLGISPDTPSVFRGCCGAGGAVSAFDANRQGAQADSKLSFAPDGSTVVTMCPTCTYTYAQRLMAEPRDLTNKHYTELLFENQFDWPKTFAELEGMYSGEYGPWLAQVFA